MSGPAQNFKGVLPYTLAHQPFPSQTDQRLIADFGLAYGCLGDEGEAYLAVLTAWNELNTRMAAQSEAHRPKINHIAGSPRGSYKPFIDESATRQRLLLGAIRDAQKRKEAAGDIDDSRNIPWLSLEIALQALHHTPFHAAVGMSRVIARYSGKQTLDLYDHVTRDMEQPVFKSPTEICRVEDDFAEVLIYRFSDRIRCLPGSTKRFIRVKPTLVQLDERRYWLPYYLPQKSGLTTGFVVPIKSEGTNKMKQVSDLFDISKFNEAAREKSLPLFEALASIPLICSGTPEPDPEPSKAAKRAQRFRAPACDVNGLKRALDEARRKRMSIRPVSLSIYVDHVLRGELRTIEEVCALYIKRNTRILTIAAKNREGEEVTIATHLLVHDCAKSEMLQVTAAGMGKVQCALRFEEDGQIEAAFGFIEKADPLLAGLIERNVMSHTKHRYTLQLLARIACMPDLVLEASDKSSCQYPSFVHGDLFWQDTCSHLLRKLVRFEELDQRLTGDSALDEQIVCEVVEAHCETQTLLKWLWEEGHLASLCGNNSAIVRERTDRFIEGVRASVNYVGAAPHSILCVYDRTSAAKYKALTSASQGSNFVVSSDHSAQHKTIGPHHKVKPHLA